ncbi:MAG: HEAT repeat domain-containing protein, partial [Vicinamibacteria bacterium]|nr:HEAT repeat domain-containing protein [Vicinamibacteria bacterium]
VAALGEIGDARATKRLVETLDDPGLQAAALEALRRMGGAAMADLERAFQMTGPEARRMLVNLIGKIEDRRAVKLLLVALSDVAAQVRSEAALALGDVGSLDAVRPLMDLKMNDPVTDVRHAAAIALRKLSPRAKG